MSRQRPPRAIPVFQSTHPARGATVFANIGEQPILFQSTHPARGATSDISIFTQRLYNFNPRTPRGVRRSMPQTSLPPLNFNPRTPRGVRPDVYELTSRNPRISIHAPREGCDHVHFGGFSFVPNFNPRTPRGVRRFSVCHQQPTSLFQSTHPARGATRRITERDTEEAISIHAPREGCD